MRKIILNIAAILIGTATVQARADTDETMPQQMADGMMAAGLMMPEMNAERGRLLFASTGCVVCHSVNGVGGTDGPMFDAEFMGEVMNPFEFAARMWRGAAAMVELQEAELGGQIDLTGDELADIIAFVHDAEEQRHFTMDDVPENVRGMMHHQEEEDDHHGDEEDDH